MAEETYRETLQLLQTERADIAEKVVAIDQERTALLQRITQLNATIKTLTALLENAPPDAGLADLCRAVLIEAKGRPLTPTQVRNLVVQKGYQIDQHPNPMAAVHAVLKRLAETADFDSMNKGMYYRYRPNKPK